MPFLFDAPIDQRASLGAVTRSPPGLRCFACGGPYHEASGHHFAAPFDDVVYCGACYRPFVAWMKGHLNRRWSKHRFYDEAATSIREGVFPTT